MLPGELISITKRYESTGQLYVHPYPLPQSLYAGGSDGWWRAGNTVLLVGERDTHTLLGPLPPESLGVVPNQNSEQGLLKSLAKIVRPNSCF